MGITVTCDATHPDARRSEYWSERIGRDLYVRTFAVGLVVEDREYNMRDDSDFYAIWWNPETEKFERYTYATTRAWTYPNGCAVDATPEVRARYDAHLARIRRESVVLQRLRRREYENHVARSGGFSGRHDPAFRRLLGAWGWGPVLEAACKLLGGYRGKRLRSEFRKSLARQIERWLGEPEPKYRTPLSARQTDYL